MPEIRLCQPVQASGHRIMTSPPTGESAMAIVRLCPAVQADSHLHAKLAEQP